MIQRNAGARGLVSICFVLSVLVSYGAAQGERQAVIAEDGTPLYATQERQGDPVARFDVTATVEVLEEQGEAAHVRVTAWAPLVEGTPESTVYTNESDMISVAEVMDSSAFEMSESRDDWAEVVLEGWIDVGVLHDDTEALYEEAGNVYQQYCTGCHAGYARPVQAIRSQMPPEILPDIVSRMSRGTGIADDQENLILHWLQSNPEE